jgi:triosephosphate isomerase
MYTNAAEAGRLAKAVADGVGMENRICVAVCPPFPYLALGRVESKGQQCRTGRAESLSRKGRRVHR